MRGYLVKMAELRTGYPFLTSNDMILFQYFNTYFVHVSVRAMTRGQRSRKKPYSNRSNVRTVRTIQCTAKRTTVLVLTEELSRIRAENTGIIRYHH